MFPEFAEMLEALSSEGVEYLVVGGYAVGAHAEPRATKDIDLYIRPSRANAARVMRALQRFGAAKLGLKIDDLVTPGLVFQIGVAPKRIDMLNAISGVDFDEAWSSRIAVQLPGVADPVPFIGREALLKNKRASARPQDLADAAALEAFGEAIAPPKKSKPRTKRRRKNAP